MSAATSRSLLFALIVTGVGIGGVGGVVVGVVGCATGSSGGVGDDIQAKTDAPTAKHDANNVNADAKVYHDAPGTMADAKVWLDAPPMPDAASALFCTMNSECTNAGECCLMLGGAGLCGTGVIVFGACLPQ